MEQIPDHPDIRKAENDGWGPEDDGLDDAIDYLEDAIDSINTAITRLDEAESEFYSNGKKVDLFIEQKRLADISDLIMKEIKKYRL